MIDFSAFKYKTFKCLLSIYKLLFLIIFQTIFHIHLDVVHTWEQPMNFETWVDVINQKLILIWKKMEISYQSGARCETWVCLLFSIWNLSFQAHRCWKLIAHCFMCSSSFRTLRTPNLFLVFIGPVYSF